ncbi:MAG TPA: cytochrome c maturation protein CcmE [Chitinophagaceae bacterium]|nr:cytochrome c maturation protein CcmE [Chitinophagaceae bacterium]
MKKIHIVLLVLIAGAVAVLVTFLKGASTYETVAQAKSSPEKFVHVAVKLDKSVPVEYDPQKDPNYLSFNAIDAEDSTQKMKVVYRKGEIPNLMISEKLVLKGKYEKDHFECKDVQTKCPSKYKDDMKASEKNLPAGRQGEQETTQDKPASDNSSAN